LICLLDLAWHSQVPQPGTLVMEMNEVKGVGNYQSYVQWAPPAAELSAGDGADAWEFESGVADAGTVLLHDSIVGAFSGQHQLG
jgi:hypothetical protein